jgi:hypothetical protein
MRRALEAARSAINDELFAAGAEEVEQHPTLRGHARAHRRVEQALAVSRTAEPISTIDALEAAAHALAEENRRLGDALETLANLVRSDGSRALIEALEEAREALAARAVLAQAQGES